MFAASTSPRPKSGRLIVCVNGILSNRGNWAWTREFARRFQGAGFMADAYQNFTGALGKDIENPDHVRDLARLVNEYGASEVHLVGHSNGCAVVAGVLGLLPRVDSIHLIEAAITGDCDRNGINDAIAAGRLGGATFYCSRGDDVLKYIARASQLLPLVPSFGQGGWTGPQGARPEVGTHWFPESFGHSTAVEAPEWENTVGLILANINVK